MANATSTSHLVIFESNLVVAKAMIFERREAFKAPEYATVLCCVPKESYGSSSLSFCDTKHPTSCGTFIRVIGRDLMAPVGVMSLTKYEAYLKKEGWSFLTTVKPVRGKEKSKAFNDCHTIVKTFRMLRDKI